MNVHSKNDHRFRQFLDILRISDCPRTLLKNFADQIIRGRATSSNLWDVTFGPSCIYGVSECCEKCILIYFRFKGGVKVRSNFVFFLNSLIELHVQILDWLYLEVPVLSIHEGKDSLNSEIIVTNFCFPSPSVLAAFFGLKESCGCPT